MKKIINNEREKSLEPEFVIVQTEDFIKAFEEAPIAWKRGLKNTLIVAGPLAVSLGVACFLGAPALIVGGVLSAINGYVVLNKESFKEMTHPREKNDDDIVDEVLENGIGHVKAKEFKKNKADIKYNNSYYNYNVKEERYNNFLYRQIKSINAKTGDITEIDDYKKYLEEIYQLLVDTISNRKSIKEEIKINIKSNFKSYQSLNDNKDAFLTKEETLMVIAREIDACLRLINSDECLVENYYLDKTYQFLKNHAKDSKKITDNKITDTSKLEKSLIKDINKQLKKYTIPAITITHEEWNTFLNEISNFLDNRTILYSTYSYLKEETKLIMAKALLHNKPHINIIDYIDNLYYLKYQGVSELDILELQQKLIRELCYQELSSNDDFEKIIFHSMH